MQGGFPVQLTALGDLRELELTSVGPGAFVTLPNGITNWQELRDLQLYRCGLEKLPDCISALSKLDNLLMEGFRCVLTRCLSCCMQRKTPGSDSQCAHDAHMSCTRRVHKLLQAILLVS